ncbi:MAG: hypothetical protein FWC79_04335 [Oscillospiraceae bacterium]|nr:hypothetical protein [Oscillospiraceae bacterium]
MPRINIDNANIDRINDSIRELYIPRVIEIVTTSRVNTRFSVEYVAYLNNDILSIVIRSSLTRGTEPQRVMIHTFNVDLETNQLLTLEDLMGRKSLNRQDVQRAITEIITEQARIQEAKAQIVYEQGLSLFLIDPDDAMYNVDNVDTFFIGEHGHLYIVFAYGNIHQTSAFDLVIVH